MEEGVRYFLERYNKAAIFPTSFAMVGIYAFHLKSGVSWFHEHSGEFHVHHWCRNHQINKPHQNIFQTSINPQQLHPTYLWAAVKHFWINIHTLKTLAFRKNRSCYSGRGNSYGLLCRSLNTLNTALCYISFERAGNKYFCVRKYSF